MTVILIVLNLQDLSQNFKAFNNLINKIYRKPNQFNNLIKCAILNFKNYKEDMKILKIFLLNKKVESL